MFDTGSLVPIVFVLAVAFTVVGLAKVISDMRIRRRLIDAGAAPELARAIAGTPQEDPGLYSTLKWGIVLGAVGLALILIQFLPYRSGEPIVLGIISSSRPRASSRTTRAPGGWRTRRRNAAPPNKRLKLTGGDRSKATGVLFPGGNGLS